MTADGERRIDVEWLAFAAGLKPAIRITADAADADAIAARYRARGAAVVGGQGPVGDGRRVLVLLYVARRGAEAEALCAAERPILAAGVTRRAKADFARDVGLRLGYPACCIDAFAARVLRGSGKLRSDDRATVHEDYVAAHDALAPRCDWRLNHLLLRQHQRLVSFEPCRHDCELAGALAAAIAARVLASEPTGARALFARLQRPLVLAPGGARAWVTLGRPGQGNAPTIRDATAPQGAGVAPDPADRAFAARLAASPLDALGSPPPLVLDFRSAAPASAMR